MPLEDPARDRRTLDNRPEADKRGKGKGLGQDNILSLNGMRLKYPLKKSDIGPESTYFLCAIH